MFKNFLNKELKNSLFIIIAGLLVIFFISCSDKTTNPPQSTEADLLVPYLESMVEISPFLNTLSSCIFPQPTDIRTHALAGDQNWVVIDIRSADKFAAGHIKSAVRVDFENLLSYYSSNSLKSKSKVFVVCENGLKSGYAVSLLRINGATNVYSLNFGMSSWNSKCDSWTTNTGSEYENQISTSDDKKPSSTYSLPSLTTGKTTGIEIAQTRVADLFSKGFDVATIDAKTLMPNLSNYFVVTYWPNAYYLDPGHIPGSYNFQPKTADNATSDLMFSTYLRLLPPTKTIVLCDYTGQVSAYVVAYLRSIGYDAKLLLYGGNSIYYNKLKSNSLTTWASSNIKEYELEQ